MKQNFFIPQLIVYDFDGVMTDNKVYVDEDGKESVCVHRGDGYAVRMIKDMLKIQQIILSTEESSVVRHRAKKLKIPVLYNAGDKKEQILSKYCGDNLIDLRKVLYVGNDLNDYDVMLQCGFRACPYDAEPEIINISNLVFKSSGGNGVIRELYRILSERVKK